MRWPRSDGARLQPQSTARSGGEGGCKGQQRLPRAARVCLQELKAPPAGDLVLVLVMPGLGNRCGSTPLLIGALISHSLFHV